MNECSGVARRPKIGTEISISVSGSIETESSKSASNSAVRSPDPTSDNSGRSEIVPRFVPALEETSIESRKDNKAAKTALHVCARVMMLATKRNPEQGTRSGFYKSLPQLVRSPGGVGVSGDGMPSGSSVLNPKLALRQLRIMPQ